MKALKIILIILVVVVGLYSIWMATLPSTYTLEKTATIDAPPSRVYATVSNLESWKEWSYWDKMDPSNVVTYQGDAGTVGSSYSWKGEKTGEGSLTISNLEPDAKMDFKLDFHEQGSSDGYFTFEETAPNQTEVTYGFTTDFGFFDRVFIYLMEPEMNKAFEASLADLKTHVEAMPAEDMQAVQDYQFQNTTASATPYYGIVENVKFQDMSSDFFGQRYGEIMTYLGDDAQTVNGAPFAIYDKWDTINQTATVTVAIPASSAKAGNKRIVKDNTYNGQVVMVKHMGSYEATAHAHEAMEKYLKANNLSIAGAPWEVYVTDPMEVPDTNQWVTEIYYPVMAQK